MDNFLDYLIIILLMCVSFALGRYSVTADRATSPARVCTEAQRENFAQVCVVHQPCRVYVEIDPNLGPGSFSNVTFEDEGGEFYGVD